MRLTAAQAKKFQILYKNRFGIQLSDQEAAEYAARLVRSVKFVYEPMTLVEQDYVLARQQELLGRRTVIE